MAVRIFDTYLKNEDDSMMAFINSVSKGRIIIFAIKVSPNMIYFFLIVWSSMEYFAYNILHGGLADGWVGDCFAEVRFACL